MRLVRTLLPSLFFLLILTSPALAGNAVLAAGAGYKKMVNALAELYARQSGQGVDLLYGNMARVTTLARQSGRVDIVLGDKTFLEGANLPLAMAQELGKGKLVLAFAKGSAYSSVNGLDKAGRIALPDTTKAIYGRAAREFLLSSGRLPAIRPRLVEVSTVPQVFSYLATSEVDMGFMNLTHTLNVADKIGGYVPIDQGGYSPIIIQAALLKGGPAMEAAREFLRFLETPGARAIIENNGL